jgi:hypothetical protein
LRLESWSGSRSAFSIPTAAQDSSNSNVVAEIGGHPVTADQLLEKEGGKLLQAWYKYDLGSAAGVIDNELLEMQAKKESISVDELLKRHVAVNVQEPTEDQLRFLLRGHPNPLPSLSGAERRRISHTGAQEPLSYFFSD